jgi:hypothetical protein
MHTAMKALVTFLLLAVFVTIAFFLLAFRSIPAQEDITYGVTFSKFRAEELALDWREVYEALLTDLAVKHFRFVAHWQMIEPQEDVYHFSELDYQMRRAEEEGAQVILAVGRRLPSWPECHEPEWIQSHSFEEQKDDIRDYITAVVERYKDSPALAMWQVENEPFIIGFALGECGHLDTDFLDEEIALVKLLDPDTPILITGSGELGLWNNTWERGDVFGTTLYRRVWNRDLNSYITYPTTPGFFRAKRTFTELTTGIRKPAIIAELAAEPWVIGRIIDTPLNAQLQRMDLSLLQTSVAFAARTSFNEQYLWGAEWWYYLKEIHDEPEIWNWTRHLFDR